MVTSSHRIEETGNRTSRARMDGETIVIRLARRLSSLERERHIDSLLRRMTKIQLTLAHQPLIDPFRNEIKSEKPPHISEQKFHRQLWKQHSIVNQREIEQRVHALNNRTFCVPVGNIKLRLTSSKWGSCGSNGNIQLSTALLFVPIPLQDYVIVHELAHILHRNHSSSFWKTVESVMPDYRIHRAELRKYRLPRI